LSHLEPIKPNPTYPQRQSPAILALGYTSSAKVVSITWLPRAFDVLIAQNNPSLGSLQQCATDRTVTSALSGRPCRRPLPRLYPPSQDLHSFHPSSTHYTPSSRRVVIRSLSEAQSNPAGEERLVLTAGRNHDCISSFSRYPTTHSCFILGPSDQLLDCVD
jgi:hypothetical protein